MDILIVIVVHRCLWLVALANPFAADGLLHHVPDKLKRVADKFGIGDHIIDLLFRRQAFWNMVGPVLFLCNPRIRIGKGEHGSRSLSHSAQRVMIVACFKDSVKLRMVVSAILHSNRRWALIVMSIHMGRCVSRGDGV